MRIEILHVPDCANLPLARSRVVAALAQAGSVASVHAVLVATPARAEALGMRGSPTITIDGRDPFAADGLSASLSCRLYWTASGIDGAPGVAELADAIVRAQCRP